MTQKHMQKGIYEIQRSQPQILADWTYDPFPTLFHENRNELTFNSLRYTPSSILTFPS
jgi:hypothetical protein